MLDGGRNPPRSAAKSTRECGCYENRRQRELYGPAHTRLRRQWARRIERGELPICPRCGHGIGPDQLWDLGHDDANPRFERPEHRACNRAAANQVKTSRVW
jgi:hypothetical protein